MIQTLIFFHFCFGDFIYVTVTKKQWNNLTVNVSLLEAEASIFYYALNVILKYISFWVVLFTFLQSVIVFKFFQQITTFLLIKQKPGSLIVEYNVLALEAKAKMNVLKSWFFSVFSTIDFTSLLSLVVKFFFRTYNFFYSI